MEGSYIDLILTSRRCLHQHSRVFESEMNDHHLMIYKMFKSTYTMLETTVLRKLQYKNLYIVNRKLLYKQCKCNIRIFPQRLKIWVNHSNNEFKEMFLSSCTYKTDKTSWKHRSSRPVVFCKKGVIRNFAQFTGKHLCQSLFLNKVAD